MTLLIIAVLVIAGFVYNEQVGLRRSGDALTARLREMFGARSPIVVLVGGALALVGSCLAWANFAGYPGHMSLHQPSGARLYTLLLSLVGVLALWDVAGRRAAGLAGSLGLAVIAFGNVIAIARDGGGLVNVAPGALVATGGGVIMFAGWLAYPPDRPRAEWRRLPASAEVVVVALTVVALLYLVVYALDLEDPNPYYSRFVSFLAAVVGIALVLNRLGVFAWVQALLQRYRAVTIGLSALAAIAFPFTQDGNAYWIRVAATIGVFSAAAIGLNVVVGLAGLLDLGYVAFFGVGAYVGGLLGGARLTTSDVKLNFLLVVVIGAVVAAIAGVVIGAPTLRLRGDYLAIVTLAFGEIFRITANNADGLTRGPNGISQIPDLKVNDFDFGAAHEVLGVTLPGFANYYYAEIILLALVIICFVRLNNSRIGRAWVAIREDETAAEAMGVNTVALKLLAFAIGAFMAGAAGTLNAHVATQVSPDSYTFLESVTLLAAVVLGGMGTVPGAILGVTLLQVIPNKLRIFEDKRLLLFGIALIILMRFRPEGLLPSTRRKREFKDADSAADALGGPAATGLSGEAVMS